MRVALIAALSLASSSAVASNRGTLICSPRSLSQGQTLSVVVGNSAGRELRELGVRTPQGKFLYIAFAPESGEHTSHPPIPTATFLAKPTATLDVSSAVAVDLSADTSEKIFTAPGRYTFVASENLETEDETGANLSCDVQFSKRSK